MKTFVKIVEALVTFACFALIVYVFIGEDMTLTRRFLTCSLSLAVGYSAVLLAFRHKEFITWITTLISVVIAVLLGVCVFFWQKDATDGQDRDTYRELIKTELITNTNDLLSAGTDNRLTVKRGDMTCTNLCVDLQDFCMVEAIQSRLFNKDDTRALMIMVNAIRKHRQQQDFFRSMLQAPPLLDVQNFNDIKENVRQEASVIEGLQRKILLCSDALMRQLKIDQ